MDILHRKKERTYNAYKVLFEKYPYLAIFLKQVLP